MNIKYFFITIIQLHLALCATENKLNKHINDSIDRKLFSLPLLLAKKKSQKRVCKKLQQNNLIPGEVFISTLFCYLIKKAFPTKIDPLERKIRMDCLTRIRAFDAISNHVVQNRQINR